MIAAISSASSTSGSSAQTQRTRLLGVTPRSRRLEHAHPAELRELALVRVEHELPGIPEPRLENRAFPLAQHHGVRTFGRGERRARAEDVEEHAVQVQAVDQIELGD